MSLTVFFLVRLSWLVCTAHCQIFARLLKQRGFYAGSSKSKTTETLTDEYGKSCLSRVLWRL